MPDKWIRQKAEAAEAICGALHRLGFEMIGEEMPRTWFHRGVYPKDVRIEVLRSDLAPMVLTKIEFRNLTSRPAKRGQIVMQVDVRGSAMNVFQATEKTVLRCLEIFRDTLEGKGVAGAQASENVVQSTADSNVPDTPENERDEFGTGGYGEDSGYGDADG